MNIASVKMIDLRIDFNILWNMSRGQIITIKHKLISKNKSAVQIILFTQQNEYYYTVIIN